MEYEYIVAGEQFTNDRVAFAFFDADSKVKRFVKMHRRDDEVIVFYNSDDPADSVLLPGVTMWLWGLSLSAAGAWGWLLFMWIRRPTRREKILYNLYVARRRKTPKP